MWKKILGSSEDRYEVAPLRIGVASSFNKEEVELLHRKFMELTDALLYEENKEARQGIISLMNVYTIAIDRILEPKPLMVHQFAEEMLGGENEQMKNFFEERKNK